MQKEHDDHMYSLNKMNELLKKMLINEKSSENENQPCEIDVAFWKSEFECPICFEVRLNLDMVLKKKEFENLFGTFIRK